MSDQTSKTLRSEPAKPGSQQRVVRHGKRNLAWAERELMKMQDEETDPQLRALWSTAARIARERISHGKAVVPNSRSEAIEQQEKLDRERFEGLRFERYEEEPCPNCSRVRVGKRNNGKRICEKCCWDVDANAYNSDALGLM